MNLTRRLFIAAVAVVALGATSCGSADGRKPTYPVTGKVVWLGGKPAEHASVVLHPVGDPDPNVVKPRGKVGPDGTVKLTTYETDDGAPAGEYRVTVELWLANPKSDAPPTNRLSPKYGSPDTSGLTARVEPTATTLKPIELK